MSPQQHISFFSNILRQHVIFYHPIRVFFHLNNSLGNKWFNFKIPFWSVCTIIPFPTCFPMGYLRPIMPKFYYVLAQGWALGLQLDQSSQPFDNIPQFFPQHFIHDLDYPIPQLQTSLDVCVDSCAYNNKCTRTHDAIHNTFAAITQDVNFHVG